MEVEKIQLKQDGLIKEAAHDFFGDLRSVMTSAVIVEILRGIGASDPNDLLRQNIFRLNATNMEYKYLSDVYNFSKGHYGNNIRQSTLSMKPVLKSVGVRRLQRALAPPGVLEMNDVVGGRVQIGGVVMTRSQGNKKTKNVKGPLGGIQKIQGVERVVRLRKAPDIYNPAAYIRNIKRRNYTRGKGPRILSPYNVRRKIVTDFDGTNTQIGDNLILLRDSSTKLLNDYSNDYTSIASWFDKSTVVHLEEGRKQGVLRELLSRDNRGIEYSLTKLNSELLVLSKVVANTQTKTIILRMELPRGRPITVTLGQEVVDTNKCRPKVRNFSMLMHFIQTGVEYADAEVEGRRADINDIQNCYQVFFNEIDRLFGANTNIGKYYKSGILLDVKRLGDHLQSEEVRKIIASVAAIQPRDNPLIHLQQNVYGHITGDPCAAAASVLKGVSTVVSVPSKVVTYSYRPLNRVIGGTTKIVINQEKEGEEDITYIKKEDGDDYGDYDIYSDAAIENIKNVMLKSITLLLDNLRELAANVNDGLLNMYFTAIIVILSSKVEYTATHSEEDVGGNDIFHQYISVQVGNYIIVMLSNLINNLTIQPLPLQEILMDIDSIMEYIAPYSYLSSFNTKDTRITYYFTLLLQQNNDFIKNRFILRHITYMNQLILDNSPQGQGEEMQDIAEGGNKRTKSIKKRSKCITGGRPDTTVFTKGTYQKKLEILKGVNNTERKILTDALFDSQFTKISSLLKQPAFVNQIIREYKLLNNLYKDAKITKDIIINNQDPIEMIKYIFYIYSFYFPEFLDIFTYATVVFCMDDTPKYIYAEGYQDMNVSKEVIDIVESPSKEVIDMTEPPSREKLAKILMQQHVRMLDKIQYPIAVSMTAASPAAGGSKKQQKSKKESPKTVMYKNQSYPLQYGSKGGMYILVLDKDTQKTKKKYILPKPYKTL